jgi:hypothetical protein
LFASQEADLKRRMALQTLSQEDAA